MTPAETARVLAKAAAYDQRTVGAADVAAWHEALQDLPYNACLAAVTAHYRDHTDWLKPAHIRRHAHPETDRRPYNQPVAAATADGDCPHGAQPPACALCRRHHQRAITPGNSATDRHRNQEQA